MSAGFTPGPWFAQREHCGDITIWSRHEHTHLIGSATDDGDVPTDVQANASLMSTAPELYEALSDAVELLQMAGFSPKAEHVAALRKARGEAL